MSRAMAEPASAPHERYLIGALLAVLSDIVRRRVAAAAVAAGFLDWRPTYAAVFMWLGAGGDRISVLAERVGVSKQAMGETIAYLEQHGYVERIPDPTDGRAVLVRRTERGWAVNQVARRVVEEVQDEWRQALGDDDFTQLLEHLRRLVGLLQQPSTVAADSRMIGPGVIGSAGPKSNPAGARAVQGKSEEEGNR